MIKKVFLTAIIMCFCLPAVPVSAQRSELGLIGGVSFYLGDINPKKLFNQPGPAVGVYYRYNIDTRWAVRTGFTYGRVQADDVKFNNPRGLNFRSNIYDMSVTMEINFLNFFIGSKKDYRFTPYLTGGIAVFFFNPQAHYNDVNTGDSYWVSLRTLRTEGQGLAAYPDVKTYSTAQFAIPFGIGFKYSLNNYISIGLEWTMRYTFTDYLDDVSGKYVDAAILMSEVGTLSAVLSDPTGQAEPGSLRGNPSNKDWYSYAGLTLSFKLGQPKEPCAAYKQSALERYRK